MTEITSSYENPAEVPFAAFIGDANNDINNLIRGTRHILRAVKDYDGDDPLRQRAAYAAENLYDMLHGGAYFRGKHEGTGWDKHHRVRPVIRYYAPEQPDDCYYSGNMAWWFDDETRLIGVLEWNKVKGVVIRKYKIMTFLTKLFRIYMPYGGAQQELTAEDFAPLIDVIFPDMSKLKLVVTDTPSEMYRYGHTITSCMVGENYVDFYDTAPAQGVYVDLNGYICTRAIVWTLDDGRKVMGRIYDSSGSRGTKMLEAWAAANGVHGTELLDAEYGLKITCPVHENGLPYIDDLGYAIRHHNNVILFKYQEEAREYMFDHKDAVQQTFDTRDTEGNEIQLREKMVLCEGGTYAPKSQVVVFRGKNYNLEAVGYANPHLFLTYPLDRVFRSPSNGGVLVTVADLELIDGQVYLAAELVEVNGRRHHVSRVTHVLGMVDDEVVLLESVVGLFNFEVHYVWHHTFAGRRIREMVAKLGLSEKTPMFNLVCKSDGMARQIGDFLNRRV